MPTILKTMSIRFYCRESKRRANGKSPVEMAINIDGNRLLTHLPRKEEPEVFDRLVKSRKTNPLKEYLTAVEARLREYETECIREGEPLTVESVKTFIENGYIRRSATVQSFIDDFLHSLQKKRDSGAMSAKRYRKYEIAINYFLKGTEVKPTDPVTMIRNQTILEYKHYLTGEDFEYGTIAGDLQCLKSLILFGLRNGILKENPFIGIKIGKKTKNVRFLSEGEVAKIKEKEMPNDRLEKVKDLFLFQCYTALSYCDMALLEPDDYHANDDGFLFIEKRRKKTGIPFLVVLLPEALEIAKKYEFQLPVISNQKYNAYLKEVATLCGIESKIHSHIGRHTAATFLLNKGVPMEIVAKVLGHSTTAQTRHYAKLLDDSVFREFKKLETSLSQSK